MTNLTAEDAAAAMVAAVRDDPSRRLELAARFYDRGTGRASIRSVTSRPVYAWPYDAGHV